MCLAKLKCIVGYLVQNKYTELKHLSNVRQGEWEWRIWEESWHCWSVCRGAGVLHRMDDGEMIKIMKPEANGGGAPSVCYGPTELMMDLLWRPLKGEETKAAGRGEYGGSACEESVISQAKCWLVQMAAGEGESLGWLVGPASAAGSRFRSWDEAELTSWLLFNPPPTPSYSGIHVTLPFLAFHPDIKVDIITRRKGVFRKVNRAWRSRLTVTLSQTIINVCRRDGERKEK